MKKAVGHAEETMLTPDGASKEKSSLVEKPDEISVDPEEETARVNFSAGFNRNVGDYNSVKCSVSLTLPCSPMMIDEVFAFEKEWVETKLGEYMDEINDAYGLN